MKNESDPLTRNHEGTIVVAMRKKFSTTSYVLFICLAFVLSSGLQGCSQYPLDTCLVTGKKLGTMGEPYVHDHNGTTVKFCCEPCLEKFNEEPDKYLAKLRK